MKEAEKSRKAVGLWTDLFKLAVCVFPVDGGLKQRSIAMRADKFECLPVFGVLISRVMDKRLKGLAAFKCFTVCTGDLAFGEAAGFHAAFCPAQIPRAVQISRFAPFAGL